MKGFFLTLLVVFLIIAGCNKTSQRRTEISLNGQWIIAKTDTMSGIPSVYTSKVPVPGLVDLAIPALEDFDKAIKDAGLVSGNERVLKNKSIVCNNTVYWYKRNFSVKTGNSDIVQLKINKSMYHTWVYVNGKLAGENVYCFAPSLVNIKPFLNESGKENDLVIAVGSRNNLPDTVVNGCDYEKVLFVPGIYDDVKLILSGSPNIVNVQIVPEINDGKLRVVAEIGTKPGKSVNLSYVISEATGRKVIAQGSYRQPGVKGSEKVVSDFRIDMPGAHFWSPEDPFLYEIELSTGADSYRTRFGMRKFQVCKDSAVVLLNGKPYYMRGTNVCINRFFEDSERADLPWNESWVIKLHQAFKYLHGNSIRYCIGFPPEKWYDVADSLGILIQDEYPVWGFDQEGRKSKITSSQLANEYKEWMRERWNHPCVVIWDAQNETQSDTTTLAIQKARYLDLSDRPWENGYAHPASKSDVMEAHPYLFWPYLSFIQANKPVKIKEGIVKDLLKEPQLPNGSYFLRFYKGAEPLKNPIIINEYGVLWINRDGSPTTFTKFIYDKLYPEANTPEKRLELYAKLIGMKTEYWRAHRLVAGVLEFCGLGYSRPDPPRGQTSDHWKDVRNVIYDPYFVKYVRPAFNPVGIMLDFWDEKLHPESEINLPVSIINDTYETWKGTIRISLANKDKHINEQTIDCELKALGKNLYNIRLKIPSEPGNYTLTGEITYNGEPVRSIREFIIK